MEDPGLLILPTHRVLPGVPLSDAAFVNDAQLETILIDAPNGEGAIRKAATFGPMAVVLSDGRRFCVVRPRNEDVLKPIEPKRSDAWRRLGLAFVHAYLIERLIAPKHCGGKAAEIHYVKSAAAAVQEAQQSRGSVFLMQPTTMDELRGVCQAGDLMPQKSTFFYPKLASGLVVHSLKD
jgi:hypothetical protein